MLTDQPPPVELLPAMGTGAQFDSAGWYDCAETRRVVRNFDAYRAPFLETERQAHAFRLV